jgi:cytoskeleton protein RodZ
MTEATVGAAGPGAMLRAAREKQGLHIAALAAAIKVAPRKLDALENDRWDELPDATFTRALAQTVCRSLKIDARPILDLLPQPASVALEPSSGVLNAPFRDRPGRNDPGLASAAVRPMVWAAALLMLAAAAIYFMPDGLWGLKLGVPVASPLPPSAAPALVPSSASLPVPVAGVEAAPLVSVPVTAAPAAVTASAVAPATAASPPMTAGLVQLRTRGASWVEAHDATGQVLLSRIVASGENVDLDGRLPIRLTIGNARVTQLSFRGQAVDLTERTRDNVARVELQ